MDISNLDKVGVTEVMPNADSLLPQLEKGMSSQESFSSSQKDSCESLFYPSQSSSNNSQSSSEVS